jgi:hypothetical protein
MTTVARGLTATVLLLAVCLGACTQQQMRSARDSTLGFFGVARKPAVARVTEPPPPPPAAAPAPAPEQEPVPSAAPRTPVETEGVAPPPGGRSSRRS